MSKKHSGKNNPFYGKHHSKEFCEKMSKYRVGQKHSEETRRKMSGENNGRSKLNLEAVKEIRIKYNTGKYSQKKLAEKYNISISTINRIINNLLWK